MKKPTTNLPASVRQRLLNLATERKEDFGLVLNRYGLERFLYRLSVSPHRDSFVLKGALLLQLWTAESTTTSNRSPTMERTCWTSSAAPFAVPRSAEIAFALPPFVWISETRDSASCAERP